MEGDTACLPHTKIEQSRRAKGDCSPMIDEAKVRDDASLSPPKLSSPEQQKGTAH